MAYDQNPMQNDLRPLNVARTLAEDPRISPATSSGRPMEGFIVNPPLDGSPGGSIPVVYYQAPAPAPNQANSADPGFAGLGYTGAPAVARWVQQVVPTTPQPAPVVTSPGFNQSPNYGGSDLASDEGGEDSTPGKKVKFLCSFGGKILPRPSDGALRYVGGQTRIVSVRRDVSFVEFTKKMTDTCGQDVVIKYQLPDEDLDALVSIACSDDLDHMMDEYQKLAERSSDGSAKLRMFLFPPSEVESPSKVQLGDLHDNGQRYVEAVNGLGDGGNGSGCISRLGSTASAVSTQNSDVSSIEVVDSLSHSQPEITRSPSTDPISPRMVCSDTSPPIYVNSPASPFGIPMVMSGPPTVSVPVTVLQQQAGIDLKQPGVSFPVGSTYAPPYVDTHQREAMHLTSQMGFPGQLMGTVGPMFTQQHATTQQFVPSVHTTMTTSHVSINPSMLPMFQTQQTRLEQHPQLSRDQACNASPYQPQPPATVVGGAYAWQQIPQPQQVAVPEVQVVHPAAATTPPETISRFEDCQMCQKSLPHAHSDTVAQETKGSPASSVSDSNSMHSPRLNRALTSEAILECISEEGEGDLAQRFNNQVDVEAGQGLAESLENREQPKVQVPVGVVGLTSNTQNVCGPFMGNVTQPAQVSVPEQPFVPVQYQVKPEVAVNKPTPDNLLTTAMRLPNAEYIIRESPIGYAGHIPVMLSKDDNVEPPKAYEHVKQLEGRMENLWIQRILSNTELNKAPGDDLRNNEILESRIQQVGGREEFIDPTFRKNTVLDMNQLRAYEMLPISPNDALRQPPLLRNYNVFVHPKQGVSPLVPGENLTHPAERIPMVNELQSQLSPSSTSMSPPYKLRDSQESSSSLFSNQDPWSMQHNNVQLRKELMDNSPVNRRGSTDEWPVSSHGGVETEIRSNERLSQTSGKSDVDIGSEHSLSNKAPGDDIIKQELQSVAEDVAVSVLTERSASSSTSEHNDEGERQYREKVEEIKTKFPVRENIGFPLSGDIGHLQIIKNSDLEEIRELGSGTFGTVYYGKWRGTDVAIKRINERCFAGKPSEKERMRNDFWNEAIKLSDLHHPNVVAFYGVVFDGPGGSVATVTEFMVNGSLRTALQKTEGNLDKRKRILISMDVAFGMEYLHGRNIVHFDLKSDNLLVNLRDPHRPICKVGDLGLSKVKCQTLISGGVRGTLPWMAPELLNGSSSLVSEKVDVFSFGIVMWELLTGEEPYADLHYGAIIGGIVSNTLRPTVPECCDADWKSLMERCWSAETSERPSFTEIANELRVIASKLTPK